MTKRYISDSAALEHIGKKLFPSKWASRLNAEQLDLLDQYGYGSGPQADPYSLGEYDPFAALTEGENRRACQRARSRHWEIEGMHEQARDWLDDRGFVDGKHCLSEFNAAVEKSEAAGDFPASDSPRLTSKATTMALQGRDRGGAPQKYPWDGVAEQLILVGQKEGRPETKSELIKRVVRILSGSNSGPDEKTVRDWLQKNLPKVYADAGKE